ncbi:MAG: ubiquinol-cytochrome c reductase cytochrome b subunit [Nonomuraea sp.]|nr:ubiquinol-cytochrome c reductase cytochrome b subunit [Nonomuraea sp.]NUP83226.1 ubiquinol-cytochrome c reductase cytochrome b subunit [Nonomuraea sp.]
MRSPVRERRSSGLGHWSFMFAEAAIWSFVVLVVTGVFLMVFFDPDMSPVLYQGVYTPLNGIPVSRAFDSTMRLSLEVRGGLFVRQVHHWSALVFVAAVALQLLRMFVTGAFRRPRVPQWLIWVTLLPLGMAAGETGNVLPDDMLSGGSLWLIQSVLLAVPFVGSYASQLLFGAQFPGDSIIPTMYWAHVLVIPAAVVVLLAAREWLVRRHGHSRFAASAPGRPGARPLMAGATAGVLVILGMAFQIAPIWLYGPAGPGRISAGSVPDWYMGFLDGALRIMPGWELTIGGYTLSLAVLVPTLVVPGVFFTVLAGYPLGERVVLQRLTRRDALGRPKSGSRMAAEPAGPGVLDRPRETPVKTAVAAAGVTFYGLLWAAAANDQFAHRFHLSVETVTIFFRYAVLIGPVIALWVTYRLCLGLRLQDRRLREHGPESGVIVQNAQGGFHERPMPADPDRQPALTAPGD